MYYRPLTMIDRIVLAHLHAASTAARHYHAPIWAPMRLAPTPRAAIAYAAAFASHAWQTRERRTVATTRLAMLRADLATERQRALFERDAAALGFDVRRIPGPEPEPWMEYLDPDTGHRWAGWLAAADHHRVEHDNS